MKMHRQTTGWLLILLLLAALIFFALRAQPPSLLGRAARIAPWSLQETYLRLSHGELLLLRDTDDGGDGISTKAYRRDIHTGQETPLTALNAVLAKHSMSSDWQVSPDGQTLLFRDMSYRHGDGIAFGLCGLDGSGMQDLPRPQIGGDMLWMRDGQGWAALDGQMSRLQVAVNRRDAAPEQHLTISGSEKDIWDVNACGRLMGFLANGHALVEKFQPGRSGEGWDALGFAEFAVAPHAALRSYSVPIPPGATVDNVALSPEGDRLAWLIGQNHPSVTSRFWERLLRRRKLLPSSSPHTVELYVSDPDGRRRRLIGYRTAASENDYTPLLQWSSDGKTLMFEYKDSLYTIPAD